MNLQQGKSPLGITKAWPVRHSLCEGGSSPAQSPGSSMGQDSYAFVQIVRNASLDCGRDMLKGKFKVI